MMVGREAVTAIPHAMDSGALTGIIRCVNLPNGFFFHKA
jgi:hypothetical protein